MKTNWAFAKIGTVLVCCVGTLVLSGCGKQMEDFVRGVLGSRMDFQKTEIVVSGLVPADGASPHIVVLHLKNSDNSSVPNYLPKYDISAPMGVVASSCSTSDSNGISVCIVKSIVAGTKTFQLTNAKVGLAKDIQFGVAAGFQKTNLSSGSIMRGTTPQGSVVQMTLGRPLSGTTLKTAGGYQVTFGIQGVAR